MPVVNALSRAQERRADRYALETTRNADAFITAMKRLSQQNLAEEHPSRLVRWLFYSHPPIRERIDAARAFGREEHMQRRSRLGTWRCLRAVALARVGLSLVVAMSIGGSAQYAKKTNVAHRGASAYAPEHTLAAYRLAIEMGADYVEQDLAVTKDGVLICLHDASLERTTNVEELFPDRARHASAWKARPRKAWLANDFTLAEIKRLDAGSWFDAEVQGRADADLRRGGRAHQGQGRDLSRAEDAGDLRRPQRSTSSSWWPRRSTSTACAARRPTRRRRSSCRPSARPARAKLARDEDRRAGGAAAERRRRLEDRRRS